MQKSIVFDLDGTLLHSKKGIMDSLTYAIAKVDSTLNFDINKVAIGPPIRKILEDLFPELDSELFDMIIREYREIYDSVGILKTELYPEVIDTLGFLCSKFPLYVATNKPFKATSIIIERLELKHFFNAIYCIDRPCMVNKTELVYFIRKKHGINDLIVVGDSESDYESAIENNGSFVYCSYGYGSIKINDDLISITHLSQLMDML